MQQSKSYFFTQGSRIYLHLSKHFIPNNNKDLFEILHSIFNAFCFDQIKGEIDFQSGINRLVGAESLFYIGSNYLLHSAYRNIRLVIIKLLIWTRSLS